MEPTPEKTTADIAASFRRFFADLPDLGALPDEEPDEAPVFAKVQGECWTWTGKRWVCGGRIMQ